MDTSRTTARAAPFQLFADPEFRRVWGAGALAGIMRWLDMLVVGVYVLEVTGSALLVALAMFVRMFPMFLFGAAAGAVAERLDPRRMLVGFQIVLSLVSFGLFLLAWTGALTLWHLAFGVALSGTYWATEFAVRRTMAGEIAGTDRLAAAMGLESSTNNFTRMIGPFAGGALYELFGITGSLLLGFVLYAAAAFLMSRVTYRGSAARPAAGPSFAATIVEGFRFVRLHRVVTAILAITIALNLFGFSYISMVPVIARGELGLSPFLIGTLASAEGGGAFVGAMLIAFFATPRRLHQLFFCGSVLYLCAIFTFAQSGWFWLSLPALLFGGFGASGFAALQSALVLTNTPIQMRNRVMGVVAMCIGIGPLGVLAVGLLANEFGAPVAVTVTSLCGITAMAASGFRWPEMLRLRES